MHATAVDADDRLGQKRSGESHFGRDLATDQFIELNLIGCGDRLAIAVINFKLGRGNFRMVFFILETHRALYFRSGVDKRAQRIAGQRMIIATGIYVLKLAGLVVAALSVRSLEKETFNLVGRVQSEALALE